MMIDQTTNLPLRVSIDDMVGPFIRLPYNQLDKLRRVLDGHNIRYEVQEDIISLDGGPFIIVVNLDRGADADAVQAILDRAQ